MKYEINIGDSVRLINPRQGFDLYGVYTVREIHLDKENKRWFIVTPEYDHKMDKYNHWLPSQDVVKYDPTATLADLFKVDGKPGDFKGACVDATDLFEIKE